MFNTEPLRRAIEETYLEGEAFVRPEKMAAHNGVRRISRSLSKCYTRQFRTIINRVSIATPRLTVEKWSREGVETNRIRENRWKSWVFFRFLAMERMIRIFENISQRKGGKKERYRGISRWFLGMECEPPGGSITLRSIDWILRKFNSDLRGIQDRSGKFKFSNLLSKFLKITRFVERSSKRVVPF